MATTRPKSLRKPEKLTTFDNLIFIISSFPIISQFIKPFQTNNYTITYFQNESMTNRF